MLLYRCSQGEFSKIIFALEKDWCEDYSSTGVKFKFMSAYIDQDVTATHFEKHSNSCTIKRIMADFCWQWLCLLAFGSYNNASDCKSVGNKAYPFLFFIELIAPYRKLLCYEETIEKYKHKLYRPYFMSFHHAIAARTKSQLLIAVELCSGD